MIKALRARYEKQLAALTKELEEVQQELEEVRALMQLREEHDNHAEKTNKDKKKHDEKRSEVE